MKTYADSGVFLTAWRGRDHRVKAKALNLLTGRELVVSVWLQLELLSKPLAYRHAPEIEFLTHFLPRRPLPADPVVVGRAFALAAKHGLSALDALHVAAALAAGAEELVTTEETDKPLFRLRELRVVSLDDVLV